MQRRRRFERLNWKEQVAALRTKAEAALTSQERAEFLRLADELSKAMQMESWLSSPELRKPN
jgi:hypothetical protein